MFVKYEIFKVDERTPKWKLVVIALMGWILLYLLWWAISLTGWISPFALPAPKQVLLAYKELFLHYNLLYHIGFSAIENLVGYILAIVAALSLGFLVGQCRFLRVLLGSIINAGKYLTLPSITSVFMAAFGTGFLVKVMFLAFGIFLYLLPATVNRFKEIDTDRSQRNLKRHFERKRLSRFKMQLDFYIPHVLASVFSDIKNLVPLSWTYLIIAELLNAVAGLGYLSFMASNRNIAVEQVYALLLLVAAIGVCQDYLLDKLDRRLFKYKYI